MPGILNIKSFCSMFLRSWADEVKCFVAQIMINGFFKSPVHRVVTNAKKEKLSVALDYSVDHEREIEPSPQLINEKRPALYKKVKVKDYISGLYEHFSQGTMVIDTLQL